jgi:hypothetical protein
MAGRFGTFLMNSEKEKIDIDLQTHTASLWTFLLHPNYNEVFNNDK